MAMAQSYIHGNTDPTEVARLEKQARFVSPSSFHLLEIPPGAKVLDLATGVGAMAAELRRSFPGLDVVGVDLSANQLGAARVAQPWLPVVRGDATRLPFPDKTFDVVHCSWLLEHVPDPVAVLRDVRRVLKPGGWCHFLEVDNATMHMTPMSDAVAEAMRVLVAAQFKAGGDPFIGERIHRMFDSAGFRRFEVHHPPMDASAKTPELLEGLVEEWAEIFEGLVEAVGAAEVMTRAAHDMRALIGNPSAVLRYTPVVVRAVR